MASYLVCGVPHAFPKRVRLIHDFGSAEVTSYCLMIMNVLSRKALLKASRFIVIGIFVLSAIVTPPDFVSQISLALPLVGLFFLTILIARIFNFGKGQPQG